MNTIFFDAGGTLLHPREPVGQTYAAVARAYGADLNPAALDHGFRTAFKQLRQRPLGTIPRNGNDRPWWREVVKRSLGDIPLPDSFQFEAFFEELYTRYADPDHWTLYPEVEGVLDQLQRKGCKMAIISNWDSRLRRILDGHFLTPFFNEIFISGEHGVAKPHPRLYQLAQEKMGSPTEEILMIGDDPENDEQIPKLLGWKAILVKRPTSDLHKVLECLMVLVASLYFLCNFDF